MQSYNQIIKLNRDFADAHKVLQNFGNGERWNIVEHNQQASHKYPLMWMEDLPISISGKDHFFVFRVYFIDQVAQLKDRGTDLMYTNQAEVKSDMEQCARDLLSYWYHQTDYPLVSIDNTFTITTFTDELEDNVAGCYVDVRIKQPFEYPDCEIPMTGITPPDTDVDITVNSTTFTSVVCGGDYNVVVKDTDGNLVGSKVGSEWIVNVSGSYDYDVYFDGVDSGQNVTVDGTNITINLT